MKRDDLRSAVLRILGMAALAARWTPTLKDDAALDLLLEVVKSDDLWAGFCDLLGVEK